MSLDGTKFTEAQFPNELSIGHRAFTVLQSTTGAVFLDALQYDSFRNEYGMLLKSNSEGTNYNKVLSDTNRDADGYVDFERLQSVKGVILANQVSNVDAMRRGSKKCVRSLISSDDGSHWSPVKPPQKGQNGNTIECRDKCSLHLHSRTVRNCLQLFSLFS
jgi:hypothetical protein